MSSAIKDAQQFASYLAQGVEDEFEVWKQDHEAAMECFDFQERLALFNGLVKFVFAIVVRTWPAQAEAPGTPADRDSRRQAIQAMRILERSCTKMAAVVAWFENEGYTVDGASDLESARATLRDLMRNLSLNPNPRPVTFDDQGHLVEATGQGFEVPGLSVADIQEGLADFLSGRIRPLDDIIAGRQR